CLAFSLKRRADRSTVRRNSGRRERTVSPRNANEGFQKRGAPSTPPPQGSEQQPHKWPHARGRITICFLEDAKRHSSEIRLLPKPRLAYKDVMFESEQPVLPKETSMNAKPEFSLVDANGVRLRVAQAGKGPLIVLVHGWPESWYSWRHQIPPLAAAGYRVAAVDVRGYGGSDKPEPIEAYSIKEMCADIVGLID